MTIDTVLQINSSGRYQGSITRDVSTQLVKQLQANSPGLELKQRDLATGLPFIDEQWIGANFTDPEARSTEHRETLRFSDKLVNELQNASFLVIASPIYNFSIPAVLKAWIDLIARARLTFRYTESGPKGLLEGKKAYLVMASGGVAIGSEADLATRYLIQVLGFIGITDVTVIDSSKIQKAADLEPYLKATETA